MQTLVGGGRRRYPAHAIPDDVSAAWPKWASMAVSIGHNAKDIVLSADPDRAAKFSRADKEFLSTFTARITGLEDQFN